MKAQYPWHFYCSIFKNKKYLQSQTSLNRGTENHACVPKHNKACGRLVHRNTCYLREALRRAGTGPLQYGRVARVKKILAEPVI